MSSAPLLRFGKGLLRVEGFGIEFASLIKLDEQGRELVQLSTWVLGCQWVLGMPMRGVSLGEGVGHAKYGTAGSEKNVGATMTLNN